MRYYLYSQNNSGGSFTRPAIHIFVEASSVEEADAKVSNHITLCNGDSYDACSCCDCCGHRWPEGGEDVTDAEGLTKEYVDKYCDKFNTSWAKDDVRSAMFITAHDTIFYDEEARQEMKTRTALTR